MIDLNCAGCTNQDVPQAAAKESKEQQLASSNPQLSLDSNANSPLASPFAIRDQSSFSSPTRLTGAYQLGDQYLLPTFGPLNLLSSAATNANTQFALTPDARACVTATYLCVLIVNNTWLDCNLLEMLCNGSGQSSTDSESDEKHKIDPALRGIIDIQSLETAVNELIAFTGGGSDSRSKIDYREDQDDDVQEATDSNEFRDGNEQQDAHFWSMLSNIERPKDFQQSPFELHRSQVGLPEKGGGRDERLHQSSSSPQKRQTNRLPKQMIFKEEHVSRGEEEKEQQLPKLKLPPSEEHDMEQQGQQQALRTGMGRPAFRGWGSYAFWLGESDSPSMQYQPLEQQDSSTQFHKAAVQILRPADRGEQYNDLLTNQSLKSEGSLFGGGSNHKSVNANGPVSGKNKQSQQAHHLFATTGKNKLKHSTNIRSQAATNFPFSGISEAPVVMFEDKRKGELSIDEQQQNSFPSTSSNSFTDAFNTAVNHQQNPLQHHIGSPRNDMQLLQPYSQHRHKLSQQVHQLKQHQFPSTDDDCKCNPLSDLGTSSRGLEQHCQPPYTSRCDSGSKPLEVGVRDGQLLSAVANNFVGTQQIASTTVTPSISPGGKMNPLDVSFFLYTRNSVRDSSIGASNGGEYYDSESSSSSTSMLSSSNESALHETGIGLESVNSSLPIKIVIHGFGSGGRRSWVADMAQKLLEYEDVNVIVVDWEKGATLPNYVQAAGNTRLVGHKIASLIRAINLKYGLTGSSYHLIGFSLGAHVAGFAGMELRNSSNGISRNFLLNRITGLDPASPLFEGYEASDRLDPSDAQFVDVIHSNGDGVLRGGFGSLQPMGHVDFYPNGGRVQVGCNSVLLSALSDIIHGKWQSLCNHRRALNFFMDSFEFSKCRFRSFNCDSYENYLKGECFDCGYNNEKCSYMGYLANYSKGRGKMYLTTHEEAPFCANQFTIKIIGSKGFKTHWGKVEVTLISNDGAKNESFWLSANQQTNSASSGSGGGSSGSSVSGGAGNSMVTGSSVMSASATSDSGGSIVSNGGIQNQQTSMQSLVVAHPSLLNLTQILLRYTRYKGWIYSGDESWPIDKVLITDSEGQVKSYCGFNTILESYVTSRLDLEPGNCTIIEPVSAGSFVTPPPGSRGGASSGTGGASVPGTGANPTPTSGEPQQQSIAVVQQQQQLQVQHSARTPRLFIAQQNEPFAGATPSSSLSQALQRLTAGLDRPATQMKFVNIPQFVAF